MAALAPCKICYATAEYHYEIPVEVKRDAMARDARVQCRGLSDLLRVMINMPALLKASIRGCEHTRDR
jgi:hypothetical protein